jgi:hypothetical protein
VNIYKLSTQTNHTMMRIKHKYLLIVSAAALIAVMIQACGTDSAPTDFNLESMTAGGIDLNTAQSPDGVPVDATIEITFNSNVNAQTATSANISLIQDYDDTDIPLQISASGATITIQPEEELGSGALYQLNLGSGLMNEDDQSLASTSRSFTTAGTFSPPGIVAHWTFEDIADDITGNFPASAAVDITYDASRNSDAGQAATFNGNTSIIEIPNGDQLIVTDDFTISFWVKTESDGHVNENGDPTGHFVLGLGAFYGIQFEIFGGYDGAKFANQYDFGDGTSGAEDMWFPAEATDANNGGWQGWDYARSLTSEEMIALLKDNWLHVTFTYDSAERKARLYYDGEIMKSFDFNLWPEEDPKRGVTGLTYAGEEPDVVNELAFGFVHSRAGTLWDNEPWGGYDFTTAQHFKGQLDDVKIYHKVLSDTEIQLMFESEN